MAKENDDALRKILDFSRLIGIVLLVLNVYWFCFEVTGKYVYQETFVQILIRFNKGMKLFVSPYVTILFAMVFIGLYAWAERGKKGESFKMLNHIDVKINKRKGWTYFIVGCIILLLTPVILYIPTIAPMLKFILYTTGLTLGVFAFIFGANIVHRSMKGVNDEDYFNDIQESSFPQCEDLMENEYSVNLKTQYKFRGKIRNGWVNIINPFRASAVIGTPGSGKSYAFINEFIRQHLKKGFAMYCYDFKFPDLTNIVYNNMLKNKDKYPVQPKFYLINFDNPRLSHRCNPINARFMMDITDAYDAAYTFLLNLNRTWVQKQGDFFVESPINFLTATIWYLRGIEGGKYCTLPHAIEWINQKYSDTIPIMATYPDLGGYMAPFFEAWEGGAQDQLQGQIASVRIAMTRIISKQLYWVMSGDDFTLDLNNPTAPKILCVGNNPEKKDIYGAVLGLFNGRIVKVVNKQHRQKLSLIIDELPTIYFRGLDNLIATARSNKISTCLGFQDFTQLYRDYGDKEARAIINTIGNIFSGQVLGDTAKQLSERFGRNKQQRKSVSTGDGNTNVSISEQNEVMIPASKISALSQGCFVGSVADNFGEEIKQKVFNAKIMIDGNAVKAEEKAYKPIPPVYNFNDMSVVKNVRDLIVEINDSNSEQLKSLIKGEKVSQKFNFENLTNKEKKELINDAINDLRQRLEKGVKSGGNIASFCEYYIEKIDEAENMRMDEVLENNIQKIRDDIKRLIEKEIDKIENDPQWVEINARRKKAQK